MLRKISLIIIAACLSLVLALPVMAEHYSGGDWSVVFTADKKMESNFSTSEMQDILRGLQPGDDATFTVSISNAYPETASWYMSNKILESLEDASSVASGGGYSYRLAYTDSTGSENVLYDSETVGGENTSPAGEGLNEATSALKEFFKLDDLAQGESGQVVLEVGLDGETQNNDYQDTLAELQMNFAVELGAVTQEETTTSGNGEQPTTKSGEQSTTTTSNNSSSHVTVVKTGDTNNPFIYYVIMGAAGLAILAVAIVRIVSSRKKEEK